MTLALVLMAVDFVLGPYIQFPVFFVVPVMLAAWHYNVAWAVLIALAMAGVRFLYHWYWNFPLEVMPATLNTVMRALVLILVAWATARTALLVRRLRKRVEELEAQLPVCKGCGVIRGEDGAWVEVGSLPAKASLHCPTCEEKQYGLYHQSG
ncbi:hypothetical protein [Lacunisphaera limnophila]|nr:hypothetical protein [Lacunisphaera limnophila]